MQAELFAKPPARTCRFSPDRVYRYDLAWPVPSPGAGAGTVLFVMLNPSIADEDRLDNTIRRCVSFAAREGAARVRVANLFAEVATNPRRLLEPGDHVGPENDDAIRAAAADPTLLRIVVGWGSWGDRFPERAARVLDVLSPRCPICADLEAAAKIMGTSWQQGPCSTCKGRGRVRQLHHLGKLVGKGQPGHPLYLRSDTPLVPMFAEIPFDEEFARAHP